MAIVRKDAAAWRVERARTINIGHERQLIAEFARELEANPFAVADPENAKTYKILRDRADLLDCPSRRTFDSNELVALGGRLVDLGRLVAELIDQGELDTFEALELLGVQVPGDGCCESEMAECCEFCLADPAGPEKRDGFDGLARSFRLLLRLEVLRKGLAADDIKASLDSFAAARDVARQLSRLSSRDC